MQASERPEDGEASPRPPLSRRRPRPDGFLPLAPESVVVDRIGGRIFALVVTVGAAGALALAGLAETRSSLWWGIAGGLAAAVTLFFWSLSQLWPPLEHRHAGYRVGPEAIEIRRGVIWRSHSSVPRARIQHTDVAQGPLQRGYDLATLVIYTAGTSYSKLELPGLRHAEALRIRDELLRTAAPRPEDEGPPDDERQQLLDWPAEPARPEA